jgi:hypothetical protein
MFSVLWAKQPPTGFTTKTVVNVEIPARNSTPIGKPYFIDTRSSQRIRPLRPVYPRSQWILLAPE